MSGAEVQANAISTVLRDLPLRTTSGFADALLIAVMALVAPLAGLRFSPARLLLTVTAAVGVYVVAAWLLFEHGRVAPLIHPLGGLGLATLGTLGVQLALSVLDRERMRDAFARFVPEPVIDEALAATGDDLRLGGVRRTCTVLFSDVRGFTSFSESLEPDVVIDVLNHYLEEMSDAILDNGGTLVAYMGDGIMAVFGAPLEQPDHADRALAAASEMLGERLPRFNDWMRRHGVGDGFAMGIGLNSGHVMSGNVGSKRRLEYTAIGDTTNTAARLEAMTKGTPHQLFVADSTRCALTRDAPEPLVEVGELDVRGRSKPVGVWTLCSLDKPDGGEKSTATSVRLV